MLSNLGLQEGDGWRNQPSFCLDGLNLVQLPGLCSPNIRRLCSNFQDTRMDDLNLVVTVIRCRKVGGSK
nr:hypothetical protein Q903MT_gene3379 [Picea sitchensis]